jgi:hypothetical protein
MEIGAANRAPWSQGILPWWLQPARLGAEAVRLRSRSGMAPAKVAATEWPAAPSRAPLAGAGCAPAATGVSAHPDGTAWGEFLLAASFAIGA